MTKKNSFFSWMDFDITFCKGEDAAGNICPKRETCHRYWSELTAKQAEKLGLKYHSFMLPTIIDNECSEYWKIQ